MVRYTLCFVSWPSEALASQAQPSLVLAGCTRRWPRTASTRHRHPCDACAEPATYVIGLASWHLLRIFYQTHACRVLGSSSSSRSQIQAQPQASEALSRYLGCLRVLVAVPGGLQFLGELWLDKCRAGCCARPYRGR
ncbi:hypothetical protein BD289DRAFT_436507 [Coniella lustricola]|uniref:Uncharacterized protein n=1 Tax=Coniella lustricola TaxID=2025994 RepID=A0A2T3A579_9PEZI|nr:hypothetical protein BD289DRAFT_436507 [Coniella lustricola]